MPLAMFYFSVGICVDFCAHIVHGFLTEHGSRGRVLSLNINNLFMFPEKRVLHIMEHVAPAVMNGELHVLQKLPKDAV